MWMSAHIHTMLLTNLTYEEKMFSQTMTVNTQTNPYLGNSCKGRGKIRKKFAAWKNWIKRYFLYKQWSAQFLTVRAFC